LDSLIHQLDAWLIALVFAGAMLAFWGLGWCLGRWSLTESDQDPEVKYTDASMALLGLLLAFTFAMALGRHDHRRLMVVAESNAIGDFYTCASLLREPHRSALQAVIRDYAQTQHEALSRFQSKAQQQTAARRSQEMQGRMTELVDHAVAENTPIAICLTNTLNNLTSASASRLAAYEEILPWSVQLLLLLGAVIPSFLMGKKQGASRSACLAGTLSFVVLVALVVFVIHDLDQPSRGLITVNRESFERLIPSIAK
jgi:hypothetical protein